MGLFGGDKKTELLLVGLMKLAGCEDFGDYDADDYECQKCDAQRECREFGRSYGPINS